MTEAEIEHMSHFIFDLQPKFPPLAWCLFAAPNQPIRVQHGGLVETRPSFFVEGAWDGDFDKGMFHETEAFFGSGVRLLENGFVLVPSGTTNDFCYFSSRDETLRASNSLGLLLSELRDELTPSSVDYIRINNSILKGIEAADLKIPTRFGSVQRIMHKNLWVISGKPELVSKPICEPFIDFDSYSRYLHARYAGLSENARSSSRAFPLRIASTQSRGYDSTAINAIAAQHGLDQVFSIAQAKTHGKFADQECSENSNDDGSEIGKALGFECTYIERRAILDQLENEHVYYSSLHASEDTNLAGISKLIKRPSMLLVGCLGEITAPWRYYYSYYGISEARISDCERADHGCNGLGEARIRAGYITLPLFYLGARHRRRLLEICDSAAMDPWKLHNNYDRPLARRIAEEAGVPREAFGQVKNATAMVFTPPLNPLGENLRSEYRSYLANIGVMPLWKWSLLPAVHAFNRLIWFASPRQHKAIYYLQRLISKILRRDFQFSILWRQLDNYFFAFCMAKSANDYTIIKTKGTPPSGHQNQPTDSPQHAFESSN